MKRLLCATLLLLLTLPCLAQTSDADSPATKEDVQRYLDVVNSHDMMKKLLGGMTQGMHQMLHEQYLKHKNDLPADYESKMTAMMDDMFQNMPWDEMMQAMAPVYQKHLTRGDVNNLVTFYSSPTGEKLLREMPAIMAEAMQKMTPILTDYMDTVQKKLLKETDVMIAESKKQADTKTPATPN